MLPNPLLKNEMGDCRKFPLFFWLHAAILIAARRGVDRSPPGLSTTVRIARRHLPGILIPTRPSEKQRRATDAQHQSPLPKKYLPRLSPGAKLRPGDNSDSAGHPFLSGQDGEVEAHRHAPSKSSVPRAVDRAMQLMWKCATSHSTSDSQNSERAAVKGRELKGTI